MKFLGKSLIVIALVFVAQNATSQITLAFETFGTGAARGTLANGFVGDIGVWTVANTGTNGAAGNNWYVSGEECGTTVGNCGFGCTGGNNTLHVSAVGGFCGTPDCGAAYDETGVANQTNQRAISPIVDCTNHYFIELNFEYIAAQGDDGFWVEYSLDGGTNWFTFTGGNVAESGCCCVFPGFCTNPTDPTPCADLFSGQGYWTAMNLSFPAGADNNNQVRAAFHWSNDGNGVGTDPSVAIDDVEFTHATSLPIEITSFSGTSTGQGNLLNWTSMVEEDFSHFYVQYSEDGVLFNTVQRVNGKGSITDINEYQFLHNSFTNESYYRLRMEDLNGQYNYSNTVVVRNELSEIYYRNQVDLFTVYGLQDYSGQISVYDISGKQVMSSTEFGISTTEVQLNLETLISGIYIIEVNTTNGDKRFKIMKQ